MSYGFTTSSTNLVINTSTMTMSDTFMFSQKHMTESINDILDYVKLFGFSKELTELNDKDVYVCWYQSYKIEINVFYKGDGIFRQKTNYSCKLYLDSKCLYIQTDNTKGLKYKLKELLKPEYRKYKIKKLLRDGK